MYRDSVAFAVGTLRFCISGANCCDAAITICLSPRPSARFYTSFPAHWDLGSIRSRLTASAEMPNLLLDWIPREGEPH